MHNKPIKHIQDLSDRGAISRVQDANLLFLPPANEVWGKVIFSQASVILLTGGSASVHAGIHTPFEVDPPCQGDPPLPGRPSTRETPCQGSPPPRRLPLAKEAPLPSRPLSVKETPCQGDPSAMETPPAKEIPPPRRPPSRPTPMGENEGDEVQAYRQGGNWGESDPGPHPRGKLRGIRSRPTPKGEIEGDQIQAQTWGGNSGGSGPDPSLQRLLLWVVRILLECILVEIVFPKTAWKWKNLDREGVWAGPSLSILNQLLQNKKQIYSNQSLCGLSHGR